MKTIADALDIGRSNLLPQSATAAPRRHGRRPQPGPESLDRDQAGDRRSAGQLTYGYGRVHAPIRGHREEKGGTAVNVNRVYRS